MWKSLMSSVGGTTASTPGRAQLRPAGGAPEAAQRAQAAGRRDHRGPAAQAGRLPGHAGVPAESAHHPHRRPGDQEPVPVLDAVARQGRTVRRSREAGARKSRSCPAWRTSPATWPITSPQVNVDIDRDKAARHAASTPTRSRTRSTMPTARAGSPRSTRSINEYKVLLELKPQYQADPRALSLLYFKNTDRQADSARYAGQRQARRPVRRPSTTTASFRRRRFPST